MTERLMTHVATLITVHNRKQKTLSCLQHLYRTVETYNLSATEPVKITVFLTDDGCTDGTADAILMTFPDKDIHIVQGTGSLFWAGGMRLAWQTAIDEGTAWDYYLLMNDDTVVYENTLQELFQADNYCSKHYHRKGICSGITCDPSDKTSITYGGVVFANKSKGRQITLQPTGTPHPADMTNANILLVHQSVVQKMGIFHHGYIHGCADYDYSCQAHKKGIPVMVTAHVCGECEHDHDSQKEEILSLIKMSLKERIKYVRSAVHSDKDHLLFIKRNLPLRYPQAYLMRTIRVFWPRLYYYITNARGVYQQA